MTDSAQSVSVRIGYTNHRGEFAVRVITPVSVWYGETVWHPEPQWFLKALDVEKQAERDFAFSGFGKSVMTDIPDKAVEARKIVSSVLSDFDKSKIGYDTIDRLCVAIDAALSAASPFMGAVVRELEWYAYPGVHRAETAFAEYVIEDQGENWTTDRFWVALSGERRMKKLSTLEAAKAAAQADYEARIRSALSAASPFMGAVGWQAMDTAPKDGTRIWLCNNVMHAPIIGTWDDYRSEFSGAVSKQWVVTHDPCELFTPMRYGTLICPTKWAPLPVALIPAPVPQDAEPTLAELTTPQGPEFFARYAAAVPQEAPAEPVAEPATEAVLRAGRKLYDAVQAWWTDGGPVPDPADMQEFIAAASLRIEALAAPPARQDALRSLKAKIDYRLNDCLCGMKPEFDDSITGFNEAWEIVSKTFDAALAPVPATEAREGE